MKMNKLFGWMMALSLSAPVIAYEETPPFASIVCRASKKKIQVEIETYRMTYSAGPAFITASKDTLKGGWNWKAVTKGSHSTGYYQLTIKANAQEGKGPITLKALYHPLNREFSGGSLEMPGVSGAVKCEVLK